MSSVTPASDSHIADHNRIVDTMERYFAGLREGKSALMRPSFHEGATFFGHYPGGVMSAPIQALFDWIDGNGPSPSVQYQIVNVDVVHRIAHVRVEAEELSGALAGTGVRMSDLFTLMIVDGEWKIIQKAFHWHM